MCTGGTDNHLLLWDLRPLVPSLPVPSPLTPPLPCVHLFVVSTGHTSEVGVWADPHLSSFTDHPVIRAETDGVQDGKDLRSGEHQCEQELHLRGRQCPHSWGGTGWFGEWNHALVLCAPLCVNWCEHAGRRLKTILSHNLPQTNVASYSAPLPLVA
jgi:hypothetical protein